MQWKHFIVPTVWKIYFNFDASVARTRFLTRSGTLVCFPDKGALDMFEGYLAVDTAGATHGTKRLG